VAEPAFTQAFLRRSIEVERVASRVELDLLDKTLVRIVDNPYLPERFPTFYDPRLTIDHLRAQAKATVEVPENLESDQQIRLLL